jgi:hypothetical protein
LVTVRGGQPIFYMCVGRLMRLAKKIVTAQEFVTRTIFLEVPDERRGTN